MNRFTRLLLVLALAVPQLALGSSVASASTIAPTITSAGWESGEYTLTWTMPAGYESGYSFEGRLDGEPIEEFEFSWGGELSEESGLFECSWYGFSSDDSLTGEHTLEVCAYNLATEDYSTWASTTFTVRPQLPVEIELSTPDSVDYDTACTAVITAPEGKRVTVQWVNPRSDSQEYAPVTFENGTCTYKFRAHFSGLVWVSFEGDDEYGQTTAEHNVTTSAIMSRAHAPASAKKNRKFKVWSTITPKQSKSTWVRFYCYRNEKQSNGKYAYVLRKTVTPKVGSYSATKTKMYQTFSLSKPGKWKIVPGYFGEATYPMESYGAADYIKIK